MMRLRVLLTAVTATSSLASFGAYTLLLRQLGATARVDQLFYAGSVPMSVAGVVGGVLLYLLPPRFTRLAPMRQDSATRLLSRAIAAVTAAAMSAGVAGLLWHGQTGQGQAGFWALWCGFAVIAGLSTVGTVLSCVAQARADYLATGFAPLAMSMGLLAGVLAAVITRTEWLMLVGQLAGTALSVWWLAWRLQMRWCPRPARPVHWQDGRFGLAALRPLRQAVLPISLGTAAFTLFQPIDALLCRQLGQGALTTMSFAQRVLVAVSTVVSLGAYVIAARSSHDALKQGGRSALRRQSNREAARLVTMGLLAWLAYALFGRWLLGQLVTSSSLRGDDLVRLLDCLGWMLLGVGPMAAMPYLSRVFYSVRAYKLPAVLGLALPIFYWGIAQLLLPAFGLLGLAASYVTCWWAAVALSLVALNSDTFAAGSAN
jgi:peptidoglycan biosynthesis protein MviN/MurJ (putative lipid II flippase)